MLLLLKAAYTALHEGTIGSRLYCFAVRSTKPQHLLAQSTLASTGLHCLQTPPLQHCCLHSLVAMQTPRRTCCRSHLAAPHMLLMLLSLPSTTCSINWEVMATATVHSAQGCTQMLC